jgi:hypothetical protein
LVDEVAFFGIFVPLEVDEIVCQVYVVIKRRLFLDNKIAIQFILVEGLKIIPRSIPVFVEITALCDMIKVGRRVVHDIREREDQMTIFAGIPCLTCDKKLIIADGVISLECPVTPGNDGRWRIDTQAVRVIAEKRLQDGIVGN